MIIFKRKIYACTYTIANGNNSKFLGNLLRRIFKGFASHSLGYFSNNFGCSFGAIAYQFLQKAVSEKI
jgi:hypothetical protein